MDTQLIKLAFRLGYKQGLSDLEKTAAPGSVSFFKPIFGAGRRGARGSTRWVSPRARAAGARGVRGAGVSRGLFGSYAHDLMSAGSRYGHRFLQLLGGGDRALVGQYRDTIRRANDILRLQAAKGHRAANVARNVKADLRASRFGLTGNPVEAVHGVKITPEMRTELNKVLAARAGVGTLGAVTLGHMAGIPNSAIDDNSGRFQGYQT